MNALKAISNYVLVLREMQQDKTGATLTKRNQHDKKLLQMDGYKLVQTE